MSLSGCSEGGFPFGPKVFQSDLFFPHKLVSLRGCGKGVSNLCLMKKLTVFCLNVNSSGVQCYLVLFFFLVLVFLLLTVNLNFSLVCLSGHGEGEIFLGLWRVSLSLVVLLGYNSSGNFGLTSLSPMF